MKISGFSQGAVFLASMTALLAGHAAHAAEPRPWQLGLQPAAGTIAERAHDMHNLLLVIITAISVFVLALLVFVCLRFREKKNPVPSKTTHNAPLEVIWTALPVVILLIIAVPSFQLMYYMDRTDETDMTIKVTGAQWYWNYEYPDDGVAFDSYMIDTADLAPGQKRLLDVDNPMIVPAGSRIKFLVEGNDVMHSFFVPALAVQIYSIAGTTNELWVDIPDAPRTYYGQCNQICGVNHSYMPIVIKAVSPGDYAAWLATAKDEFPS